MDDDPGSKPYKVIEKPIELFSIGVTTAKDTPQASYPSARRQRD